MDINNNSNRDQDSSNIQKNEDYQKSSKPLGQYYNSSYAIENFINVYELNDGNEFKSFDDPTYTGFKLFFHFDSTHGLISSGDGPNTAYNYLVRIGQTSRAKLLKRFINTLSKINSITPWIFQEIEGLQEVYNAPHSEVFTKKQINIQTLETIDMKMSSLSMMYRHIVFDDERDVYVVPENLREFSMSLYIYDFRNFQSLSEKSVQFLQTIDNQDVKKITHVMFDLGYCSFDITSGSQFLDSVSNNRADSNTSNLVINFEDFEVSGLFKTITGSSELSKNELSLAQSVATPNQTDKEYTINDTFSTIKNDASGAFKDASSLIGSRVSELADIDSWKRNLGNIATDASARLIDLAQSRLNALYLGNVHGFSIDDLLKLNLDRDYRNAFSNIYSIISGNKSLNNDPGPVQDLGNVNQ